MPSKGGKHADDANQLPFTPSAAVARLDFLARQGGAGNPRAMKALHDADAHLEAIVAGLNILEVDLAQWLAAEKSWAEGEYLKLAFRAKGDPNVTGITIADNGDVIIPVKLLEAMARIDASESGEDEDDGDEPPHIVPVIDPK